MPSDWRTYAARSVIAAFLVLLALVPVLLGGSAFVGWVRFEDAALVLLVLAVYAGVL